MSTLRRLAPNRLHVSLLAVLAALIVLAVPGARAFAGARLSAVVTIDTVGRKATGGVASSRAYSAALDTDSFIGCWSAQTNTGAGTAGCSAKRGSTTVSCTVDPANQGKVQDFMWAMAMLGRNSYLEFTWNSSNRCQSLKVVTDSRYAPKAL